MLVSRHLPPPPPPIWGKTYTPLLFIISNYNTPLFRAFLGNLSGVYAPHTPFPEKTGTCGPLMHSNEVRGMGSRENRRTCTWLLLDSFMWRCGRGIRLILTHLQGCWSGQSDSIRDPIRPRPTPSQTWANRTGLHCRIHRHLEYITVNRAIASFV